MSKSADERGNADDAPSDDAAGGHLTPLLIVDDDNSDSYVGWLADNLKSEGFKVEVSRTYTDARDLLDREGGTRFECVLLDQRLPLSETDENSLDGLDLLSELRNDHRIPSIIALSDYPRPDDAAIRAGADVSIKRPKDPETLRFVIESQILKSKMELEQYSCFLSYSTKNSDFAEKLHHDLQKHGIKCWFAPHDLPVGAKTRHDIHKAIAEHDKLLLVLSRNSVESDWVEDEVERALELERTHKEPVLFPIRIDNAVLKAESGWPVLIRNTRNIGDFSRWKRVPESYDKGLSRLLRDLKRV